MKKNYINRILIFYLVVILYFAPIIILSQNIETLPSFIHDVLVEEIYQNATIDSLDKYILKNAIWDSLQNVTSAVDSPFREGRIVELDIDFKIINSDEGDSSSYSSIEITVQLVYDTSEANLLYNGLFAIETPSILLSTTENRLINSFTFNIDRSVIERKDAEQQITSADTNDETDPLDNELSNLNNPGIYLIFLNGTYQDYTYEELSERAFANKRLTDISIPDGISTIGVRSFANNRLRVISIPHSVNLIKSNAFERNRIETVSIGENVQLERNAIGRNFESFYRLNGSKAGIYSYNDNINNWVYIENK